MVCDGVVCGVVGDGLVVMVVRGIYGTSLASVLYCAVLCHYS